MAHLSLKCNYVNCLSLIILLYVENHTSDLTHSHTYEHFSLINRKCNVFLNLNITLLVSAVNVKYNCV